MKIIISLFLSLLSISHIYADNSCSYQSQINQCIDANKWDWARSITDFICLDSNDSEKIAYQIIFDLKFKEIDNKASTFLTSLQKSYSYYFWSARQASYIDWINEINNLFSKYGTLRKQYDNLCNPTNENSIIQTYLSCSKDNETIIDAASKYFQESTCMQLAEFKLFIDKKVAYDLLQINKVKTMQDYRKKQVQTTRKRYDSIITDMYNNLDYITRINNQRNKVTKSCQTISWD